MSNLTDWLGQVQSQGPVDRDALRDRVIAALKEIYDPELPVNIYDLGLIYAVDVDDAAVVEDDLFIEGAKIPGVRLIGTAKQKSSIISFVMDGVHPHDIGTVIDGEGIAIRTGHHCAMPLMKRYGVAATARASFALYNTREEAEILGAAIWKVKEMFNR